MLADAQNAVDNLPVDPYPVKDVGRATTRTKYLDRIIELNGTPDIKIITGIRRSGKSNLMQAYIQYLKSHFENINIIFIDFMELAYEEIREYHALHAYVEEHYQAGKTNYLFVDLSGNILLFSSLNVSFIRKNISDTIG